MTTEELIAILEQHPGKRVVIDGYEYGLHDVTPNRIKLVNIKLDVRDDCYVCGPHEEVFPDDDEDGPGYQFDEEALLIERWPDVD